MYTLIHNIGQLLIVPPGPIAGPRMAEAVQIVEHATVVIEDDKIKWFGRESDLPPEFRNPPSAILNSAQSSVLSPQFFSSIIDARGGCVIPGLIDCHTHTVFAGTREHEFALRCAGKTYKEIARAGGGIRNTMQAVRAATKDQLIELARPRLRHMLQNGVTCVEIKSGYGLTPADELKMLNTLAELRSEGAAGFSPRVSPNPNHAGLPELVSTYLAAHTIPPEFTSRADEYLDQMFSDDMLKQVAATGAEFCDVFCENIAFSVEQSRRLFEKAKRFGLRPRVHADQITQMGASRLAGKVGAISADHLEKIDDAGLSAMKAAGTIAVLLPGSSFFLGVPQAPARRILDAGLPVAIATDFNPGSCMISSLPLVMSIACCQRKMTPLEVLVACTANAAAALNRHDRLGAVAVGHQADLVILATPNFDRFLYEIGQSLIQRVIRKGIVTFDGNTTQDILASHN